MIRASRDAIFQAYVEIGKGSALFIAGLLLAAIAVLRPASGALYLMPALLAAGKLPRWQGVIFSLSCAVISLYQMGFLLPAPDGGRILFALVAFTGSGLFVYEHTRNRLLTEELRGQVQREANLRRDAEEQFRVLIESSPAAILTLDSSGSVLLANEAAHRLLSSATVSIVGQPISRYLPLLADALRTPAARFFRTSMQCRGQRENGDAFFAQVWFSTYATVSGPRLAAIVVDSSEDLRDREEHGLHQLLSNTRILVCAVSHEIRNFCAAIAVMHANLGRIPDVSLNPDFRALGSLVEGLGKIASAELNPTVDQGLSKVDLVSVIEEVRLIAGPSFEEAGVKINFTLPSVLPAAWGDHHGVLQVFLNLVQNARRVLEHCDRRELTISTTLEGDRVVVRFSDTGPGIPSPERLFRPFQHGADVAGLGLYVSRAIVRSFRGELRHEPLPAGCCFAVELRTAASQMRG